jgi:hypothetical protein
VLSLSLALFLALFVVPAAAAYVPHAGDYFSYYEIWNLGNGTGSYNGYTEQTIVNGTETMNGVSQDGIVSANYSYSSAWSNNAGGTENESPSGDFTFSSVTFLYVSGADVNLTEYANPSVWFYMDNSTGVGGVFYLLDTEMTVVSDNSSYFLPSQGRYVSAISAEGASNYQRNDDYGQFTATYTWDAYFDPATGYIIGYSYNEQDTNSSDGFTIADNLYVTSTSYPLTAAAATSPSTGNSDLMQYAGYIAAIVIVIVIVAIIIYAISRRRTLPKHSAKAPSEQYSPPRPGPPPERIDLTPKEQPPVQQIVVKEVVKVKCRYCGALIDSTAETCPFCGAPRS